MTNKKRAKKLWKARELIDDVLDSCGVVSYEDGEVAANLTAALALLGAAATSYDQGEPTEGE